MTEAMVASMKPGSVIVDIASDAGGNCAADRSRARLIITANGVKVLGCAQLARPHPRCGRGAVQPATC